MEDVKTERDPADNRHTYVNSNEAGELTEAKTGKKSFIDALLDKMKAIRRDDSQIYPLY